MDNVLDFEETGEKALTQKETNGSVTFTDEVLASIAGQAAGSVDGVKGLDSALATGITGKNKTPRGIRVEVDENDVTVTVSVTVEYPHSIIKIAHDIQGAVKSNVESMTGMTVKNVNVNIQGVELSETA